MAGRIEPPLADGSEHHRLEDTRLELEQDRLTKHVVAPGHRKEFEAQAQNTNVQVVEDQKLRAAEEKKKHLPQVDLLKKDAPTHLDKFELDYVVSLTHNKLTEAFNNGKFSEIGELFSRDAAVTTPGGTAYKGRDEIVAYFQRLAASGATKLSHQVGNANQDNGFELSERNGRYSSSRGQGSYSASWKLFSGQWLLKSFAYSS